LPLRFFWSSDKSTGCKPPSPRPRPRLRTVRIAWRRFLLRLSSAPTVLPKFV